MQSIFGTQNYLNIPFKYKASWGEEFTTSDKTKLLSTFITVSDLIGENLAEYKYAFYIYMPSRDKYLGVFSDPNDSTKLILQWKTVDASQLSSLDFYWFISTGKSCKLVNIGKQALLSNTNNIFDTQNLATEGSISGFNVSKYTDLSESNINNFFLFSQNFAYQQTMLFSDKDLSVLTINPNNNFAEFKPVEINAFNEVNQDSIIEVRKTILPGKTTPTENDPNGLNYYAPLLYCCGGLDNLSSDENVIGSLLSNSFSNRKNVCPVIGLDIRDQTEASNCTRISTNVCTKYFPVPVDRDGNEIFIIDDPNKNIKSKTPIEIWNKYLEWQQLSSAEGKMCHCFVPDAYYRTEYKSKLIADVQKFTQSNSVFKGYGEFLNNQIDKYVFAKYPIRNTDNTVSSQNSPTGNNPFFQYTDKFIPGRCYDKVCQTGFPINKQNAEESKVTLDRYKNLYSTNNEQSSCGNGSNATECVQLVFNIAEKSSVNVDTKQTQQCGYSSSAINDPFKLKIGDYLDTCINGEYEIPYMCPYDNSKDYNIALCQKILSDQTGKEPKLVKADLTKQPEKTGEQTFYPYKAIMQCSGTGGGGTVSPTDKFSCVSGFCRVDPNGIYNKLSDCQANCTTSSVQTKYSCINGKCQQDPNGIYIDSNCLNQCNVSSRYNCVNGKCLASSGGLYSSLTECQNSTECKTQPTINRYTCGPNSTCIPDPQGEFSSLTNCLANCKQTIPVTPSTKSGSKIGIIVGVVIFILILLGAGFYFYKRSKSKGNMTNILSK